MATFIEPKPTLAEYKVIGTTANTTSTAFALGALSVDYASATLSDFDGAAVADGQLVEVKTSPSAFTAPDFATADQVERLPLVELDEGAEVELEGFISRFGSVTDFDIGSLTVTTNAQTAYENGDSASLAVGVKVEAEGTVNASGVLLADEIEIEQSEAARIEGNIEAIDTSQGTITALGVTIHIQTFTELEDNSALGLDPLTLADLGIGDRIEMRGYLDNDQLIATEAEREDFDDRSRLRGPVAGEVEPGASNLGSVDILGVTVSGESGITEYRDANDAPVTQAAFHAAVDLSTFVEAEWDVFSATSVTADELSLEDDED